MARRFVDARLRSLARNNARNGLSGQFMDSNNGLA